MTFNLDCLSVDPADLANWAQAIQTRPRLAARDMFPMRPAGYVKATRDMAHYAWNKAAAMRCRSRGDVMGATLYEGICDRIYEGLPEFARW